MSTKQAHEDCVIEKKDPRVVRTRKALDDALKSLLMERRLDEITVQDIAERAGVNRATFYAHFQDKYDLLESSLGEGLQGLLIAALTRHSPFDRANLSIVATTIFEFLRKISGGCARRQDFQPLLETTVQGTIYEFILRWQDLVPGSPLVKGNPPETVATVYAWAIFGAGIRWARTHDAPKVEKAVNEMLNVLLGPA